MLYCEIENTDELTVYIKRNPQYMCLVGTKDGLSDDNTVTKCTKLSNLLLLNFQQFVMYVL